MNKDIGTPKRMQEILQKHNFKFKKSLGQNFLLDGNILRKILLYSKVHNESGVIEIGAGCGALTEWLARKAKKVVAYEIDQRLVPILQEVLLKYQNITIKHEDILVSNLIQVVEENLTDVADISVVANVPYYITTAIIMKFLQSGLNVSSYTIMMQKEVADRITAPPGTKEYGSLSIAVQYYAEPKVVMKVPKTVFIPQPKIESVVLHMETRKTPRVNVTDENFFFNVLTSGFAMRRKTILNNLLKQSFLNTITKEDILYCLEECNIDVNKRGEQLTLEQFAMLANSIYKRCN